MQVLLTENNHPPQFDVLFAKTSRDAFHESAVLSAVASRWYSVLIIDRGMAFHNAFAPSPIGDTGFSDVEPLMGYAGPLANTADGKFIGNALEAYSAACRELKIVAELVRFNPLLNNHLAFLAQSSIEVICAKRVVVMACSTDEETLLAQFSKGCRRDVRLGLRRYTFRRLAASETIRFRELYEASVRRLNSDFRWLFSDRLYRAAAGSDLFSIYGVYDWQRLVSASLVLHHETCSHYVLAANAPDYPAGANELLIYGIARESAGRGINRLMLGGGITSSAADGAFRFKQKFAAGALDFHIGKIVHDRASYLCLCAAAAAAVPDLANSPLLMKYRLAQDKQPSDA